MRVLGTIAMLGAMVSPVAAAGRPVTVFLDGDGAVVERDGKPATVPAYAGGPRNWEATVACVRRGFERFQVEIVEEPPAAGEFIHAMVGGLPAQLGLDESYNGVGDYNGEVIRGGRVHVFSASGPGEADVANVCAVSMHEVGHALGLDHSFLCGDVMSYFHDACGEQTFRDVDAPCGEHAARACGPGDSTQNSFRRLAALVGLREDAAKTPSAPSADIDNDVSEREEAAGNSPVRPHPEPACGAAVDESHDGSEPNSNPRRTDSSEPNSDLRRNDGSEPNRGPRRSDGSGLHDGRARNGGSEPNAAPGRTDDVEGDVVEGDDIEGDDIEGDDIEGDDVEGDDVEGDDVEGDGRTVEMIKQEQGEQGGGRRGRGDRDRWRERGGRGEGRGDAGVRARGGERRTEQRERGGRRGGWMRQRR